MATSAETAAASKAPGRWRRADHALDGPGLLIAAIAAAGLFIQPFAVFRANRIVPGEAHGLFDALPWPEAAIVAAAVMVGIALLVFQARPLLRLVASLAILLVIAVMIGRAGSHLMPEASRIARVSPGSGLWILLFAFALMLADALNRLALAVPARLAIVALVGLAIAILLAGGVWQDLSIMKEYAVRADAFGREARAHLLLAFGSLAAAVLVGVPLGVLCYRMRSVRAVILNMLNIVQTIPSIALFGLLIPPLGWLAVNVPLAGRLGIAGIGFAPALVALFFYSLLPVVSNTVIGLEGVPRAAREAARGMGMTWFQRLRSVELPLALPVLLAAIRIVLVQNIGLATIAGLIGGGGFGVFVFQGISQTATDLVLLGALPTVALAVTAGIVLDAMVELSESRVTGRRQ